MFKTMSSQNTDQTSNTDNNTSDSCFSDSDSFIKDRYTASELYYKKGDITSSTKQNPYDHLRIKRCQRHNNTNVIHHEPHHIKIKRCDAHKKHHHKYVSTESYTISKYKILSKFESNSVSSNIHE
jgi:hypothetical protein